MLFLLQIVLFSSLLLSRSNFTSSSLFPLLSYSNCACITQLYSKISKLLLCECTINKQQTAWSCALTCIPTHTRTHTHMHKMNKEMRACTVYTLKHDSTRFSTSKTSRKSTTCVLFWHSTAQHSTTWA